MQLALSTTIAPPPLPVWDELSGNLRQGFTTKNQGWNPGPNVVNSTTAIGFWPSLFLEGFRQSHSARYYNPITGRFIGRDPEDGDPLDPSTLHKYLYAGGNPIGAWDPTGRSAIAATAIGESWDTAKAAAAVTLGLAIQCAYDLLASKHTTYVQLGLAGGIGFGTVHSTSLCTVGGSDPCQPYEDAIQQWMATVQKRYRDLERDWCGLYPWRGIGTGHNPKYPRAGTWFGHHWWYTNVAQAALRAAIEAAQQHGCPIPPEAYYWATIGPPSCPR